MCIGKGIAIVANNNKPMAECTGVGTFDQKALPMIMVPTTAGSGPRCRNGPSSRMRCGTSSCSAAARSRFPTPPSSTR
ncbi:MAG: hypothetical protein ACRYG8_40150 [Janthinobacterium lividum]